MPKTMNLEELFEQCASFDGFDDCIIGKIEISGQQTRIVYDEEKVIESIIQQSGMNYEEAVEYFYYNIAHCYIGESTPAFFQPIRGGIL